MSGTRLPLSSIFYGAYLPGRSAQRFRSPREQVRWCGGYRPRAEDR